MFSKTYASRDALLLRSLSTLVFLETKLTRSTPIILNYFNTLFRDLASIGRDEITIMFFRKKQKRKLPFPGVVTQWPILYIPTIKTELDQPCAVFLAPFTPAQYARVRHHPICNRSKKNCT